MGETKLTRPEVFQSIVLAMRGQNPALPEFKHTYHVIEPEPGIRELLLESSPGKIAFCQLGGLASSVLNYVNGEISLPQYLLTFKQSQEIALMWMHMVDPICMPKLFAFRGDKSLAFHRSPFAEPQIPEEAPPLFADLLARSSDPKGLAAFIGSIFTEKADRQQYLYIHGDGRNGKSALIDVLDATLGPGLHTEVTPDEKRPPGSHWTSSFLGKRLVVFSECESPKFPTSGIFKALTGGDKTLINQKFKAAYSTKLNCKFIFLANSELQISSSTADQRRAIYCFIKKNSVDIEDYADKMLKEAPQIIGYCIGVYAQACPTNGPIAVTGTADRPAMMDMEQEMFFDKYFDVREGGLVPLQVVQHLFKVEKITSGAEQGRFYSYVRLKHKLEKTIKGPKKARVWCLEGVALSSNVDYRTMDLHLKLTKNSRLHLDDVNECENIL